MMLKGLTVQYLIRQIHKVAKGDTILFHAAAGGVGLIACQWAKSLGATVIGTVGSEEKAKIAKAHGCDYPVIYTREDFVARVKEITRDQKLPVVYDSVGKDTFMKSLDCLKPKGMMVSFGQSSGSVGPIDLGVFGQKGSLFFTRPTLNTYAAARADLSAMAKDLFGVVLSGAVKIEIKQTYPLKDAAQAHRDLESRKTVGSTVLTVCDSNPRALAARIRLDGIFGNHRSEDTPLRLLTARAVLRAHRILPGRSPSPRGVRARESGEPSSLYRTPGYFISDHPCCRCDGNARIPQLATNRDGTKRRQDVQGDSGGNGGVAGYP
jgi:hypothetical protein